MTTKRSKISNGELKDGEGGRTTGPCVISVPSSCVLFRDCLCQCQSVRHVWSCSSLQCVYLSALPSLCLSVYSCVYTCPSVYLLVGVCMYVCILVLLSIYQSVYLCMYTCPSVYLLVGVCMYVYLSFCLSISNPPCLTIPQNTPSCPHNTPRCPTIPHDTPT